MQLNNQPNWSDRDIFTSYTFNELLQQARSSATPYYVFAQVILESNPDGNNFEESKYYDGISFHIYQRKLSLPFDPLTKRKIIEIHYFAVKCFSLRPYIPGEAQVIENNQNLEAIRFPPPFYNHPLEIPEAEISHYAFDAVNFHAKDYDSVRQIKETRVLFSNYFIILSLQCLDNAEGKKTRKILEEEALLWQVGANKLDSI